MKSLSEFDSLADAQAYTVESYIDMSTSVLNAYIGAYGLANFVNSLSDDKGSMLNETRASNGNFTFDESDPIGAQNLMYIDGLTAANSDKADLLVALKADLIDYCKSVTYPYANTTQQQFNAANDKYTEATFNWPSDNTLKLAIADNTEKVQVTLYGIGDDFDEPQKSR